MKVGSPATPAEHQPLALEIDRDAVVEQGAVGERRDARGPRLAALDAEHTAPVMLDREGQLGPRHRETLHHVEARGIFGSRRPQEFAPRRHALEQRLDANPRPRRQRGRPLGDARAIVDRERPALLPADPALERQPRDAGDRGQRLAAKAERRDAFDRIVRKLGSRVALERQRHFRGTHRASVVSDLDQVATAAGKTYGDPGGARVDRVFHQFLQCAGGSFDDFSRGNPIDEMFGQAAY